MKWCLWLLLGVPLFAQNPAQIIPTSVDPTGQVCNSTRINEKTPDGKIYTCQNGLMAQIGGTGGGGVTLTCALAAATTCNISNVPANAVYSFIDSTGHASNVAPTVTISGTTATCTFPSAVTGTCASNAGSGATGSTGPTGPTGPSGLLSGALASIPGTCTVGAALYQATDQPIGLQLYACTTTNNWMRIPYAQGASNPGTCTVGQIFFNTAATAGSNLYLCTSTNTFTQVAGSGGGAVTFQLNGTNIGGTTPTYNYVTSLGQTCTASTPGTINQIQCGPDFSQVQPLATYLLVTFSATPVFVSGAGGTTYAITLTGNVTSSTISGVGTGQTQTFIICQDGTGSRTFAWPTAFKGTMTIGTTASKCNVQSFVYDGTNYWANSTGVINQ